MIRSLFHLLDRAAERCPDRTALRMGGARLSYAELHRRASAIGAVLRADGLERPDRVGLLMPRSFDSMAAIYGIMQAGGAYVPLDPTMSPERSGTMLRNAGAKLLLAEPSLAELAAGIAKEHPSVRILGLGTGSSPSWPSIYAAGGRVPDFGLVERDLAVMFHTSGTTGIPKGVPHSHRSMLTVIEWAVDRFGFTSEDVFVGVTSHSFELSWLELFASMLARGELVLAPEESVRFSPKSVATLAASERVTVWCSVPSLLMRMSERGDLESLNLSAIRRVHFAGERFPTPHLRRLRGQLPHAKFCNMLGTTETHICAFYEIEGELPDDAEAIPVGKACAHLNLGAIGPNGQLVADGEVGELVVRGPNLMNGYWQLPERTAQAIIDCRFGPELVDKAYRTGDLVRKDARGDYHIIGRADRRIKVLGHLVDLDEVEAVILSADGVLEVAAFSAESEGSGHVEAAVVPVAGRELVPAQLRVHVARVLPLHAVPERIHLLKALPRLGNGKISRRAIQEGALALSLKAPAEDPGATPIEQLRRFIAHEILEDPGATLDPAEDLLGTGVLTSMSVVRLVEFVERRFGLTVPNEDFAPDHFRSLSAMEALIGRLRGEP